MNKTTTYKCPMCSELMFAIPGTQLNPKDGVTLWCDNEKCPPHENVQGHGKDEKSAYEIVIQKYKPSKEIA